jgi:hypothetical protein
MQIDCKFMLWNAASQKIRFQMVSADALTIFSGIIILFRNSGKSADFPELPFHGRGRNGKQHLQGRCGKRTLSGSLRSPAPPKGELYLC